MTLTGTEIGYAPAYEMAGWNLRASSGNGSPLPEAVRSYMEPRFGTDFSGVRVHTGSEAQHLNRALNAQAFTVGTGKGTTILEFVSTLAALYGKSVSPIVGEKFRPADSRHMVADISKLQNPPPRWTRARPPPSSRRRTRSTPSSRRSARGAWAR